MTSFFWGSGAFKTTTSGTSVKFSQQYGVPEQSEPPTGTLAGLDRGPSVSVKTGFAGTVLRIVFNMGVALGQITSPKHPAGILVIAVLAAMPWPNQENFFNAVC